MRVTLSAAKDPYQKMRPMNNSLVFISVCSSRWSLNGQDGKKNQLHETPVIMVSTYP